MRSIPLATTWELLRHGWWQLLGGALGANFLSVILLAALRKNGALDPSHPSLIVMHVVLAQLNMVVFAATVLWAQRLPARLFARPLTNATIAACHMLPASALTAVQFVLSTAALNAVFGVGWPLWGPALFVAVMVGALQAILWLTEKSAWLPWGVAVVGGFLGLWIKSRYGAPFSAPEYYWRQPTVGEIATLLAVAALAYATAVTAIARNRCGEGPISLGIVAWIARWWDSWTHASRTFSTAERAQFWFEWRQKGWVMPAVLLFGMSLGCGCWALFSRDPQDLLAGFVTGGWLITALSFVGGVILGNTGPKDQDSRIGTFLATRPLTNRSLARTILLVAAASVGATWILWASSFLTVYLVLLTREPVAWTELQVPESIGGWYFPATLVGAWTTAATIASVVLAGRGRMVAKLFVATLILGLVVPWICHFAVTDAGQVQLASAARLCAGVLLVLGTCWIFVAALSRGLIAGRTLWLAAGIETALSLLVALAWPGGIPLSTTVLVLGAAVLAVAPLAAAPLTLSWNRHR